MQRPQTIVTHNGNFHPDDVFAVATLLLHLGDTPYEIIRTRDKETIEQADWVIDVGEVYDPNQQRFDHHQNGAPVRENGLPYAAFGLIWKSHGTSICRSAEVAETIDAQIAQQIDAGDNGVTLYSLNDYQTAPAELFAVILSYRPLHKTSEMYNSAFLDAVAFAKGFLERTITYLQAQQAEKTYVASVYEAAVDKRILEFDHSVNRSLLSEYPEVEIIIYPRDRDGVLNWCAETVPEPGTPFITRTKFPEEWGGLREAELREVSGIPDAVFSHKDRFLFVANSKEGVHQAVSATAD